MTAKFETKTAIHVTGLYKRSLSQTGVFGTHYRTTSVLA